MSKAKAPKLTRKVQNFNINLDDDGKVVHLSAGVTYHTTVEGMDFQHGNRLTVSTSDLTDEERVQLEEAISGLTGAFDRVVPVAEAVAQGQGRA